MDIRMPGQIDGIAAIRQLRNGPNAVDTPIIVISAWGGFEYKALRAGADVYLAKPVPVDELFVTINRHLRQPPLSQNAFLGSVVKRA
jgi:DNA-binding response OmpR family regulator